MSKAIRVIIPLLIVVAAVFVVLRYWPSGTGAPSPAAPEKKERSVNERI